MAFKIEGKSQDHVLVTLRDSIFTEQYVLRFVSPEQPSRLKAVSVAYGVHTMKRLLFAAAVAAMLATPALLSSPAAAQQGFTPGQRSGAMMQRGGMGRGGMMRPMRTKKMMHHRGRHSNKMMMHQRRGKMMRSM